MKADASETLLLNDEHVTPVQAVQPTPATLGARLPLPSFPPFPARRLFACRQILFIFRVCLFAVCLPHTHARRIG